MDPVSVVEIGLLYLNSPGGEEKLTGKSFLETAVKANYPRAIGEMGLKYINGFLFIETWYNQ